MYSNSNKNLAFNEINNSLNKIYKYLNNPRTEEFGNELYKNLISKYISQNTLIFSIINSLEEKIKKITSSEIQPYINLLSNFFENDLYDNYLKIYLPYLNPILSIIQSLIIEKNIKFLSQIPEIFMKIVQNLTPDDITASNKNLKYYEKKIYEILQNFCFYNLKNEQKINQVIGSLCLTKLVENCPYVLKDEYIEIIINEILSQLSLDNFQAKQELLNCLISLILGAENIFKPYAKIVFNKIIDFLTNDNWVERKLSLNIIYTIVFYCKDEMISLKENILNILNILKNDKVKEIRDICLLIKSMLENDKKEKNNLQNKSKKNNITTKNNKNHLTKKRNNHLSSGNIISKIGKINYIKYNNISSFSTNRNTKNKIQNIKLTKPNAEFKTNIEKENNKLMSSKNSSPIKPKSKKPSINLSSSDINKKNKKKINRTKNFSFVNEKMIIRPDPKKSIFNSHKNMAFFKQNNNNDSKNKNLIIISSKDDNNDIKKNYNTFEGFYKKENNKYNNVNNSEIEEKNKENNITTSIGKDNYSNENEEKIDKDYENNKDNINKLIELDEKIKKENIKKIDNNSILSLNDKAQSFLSFQSFKNIEYKQEKHNNNNKENLIKALLSEVRELSNKQISLLDLMDEIQTNTQNQIEELNSKIINLDDTIKELNEQLYILQNEQ